MSEDLLNEIEAINSIYGPSTLVSADETSPSNEINEIYILALPNQDTSLRIQFPAAYPDVPPVILGTQHAGQNARKGDAGKLVEFVRTVVGRTWRVGEVCLFDVIEEVEGGFGIGGGVNEDKDEGDEEEEKGEELRDDEELRDGYTLLERKHEEQNQNQDISITHPPNWILSSITTELKSTFIARCISVSSPTLASQYIQNLLSTDKKVRSATHNITAWRIKTDNGITYQDCDDDGESAAGGRLLHLMQLMDLWNVMVVVTRWYGGQKLGARRFAVINAVARDAFVKGGFVVEKGDGKKGKK
ncbi:b1c3478c-0cf1-4eef-af48-bbafc0175a85-CDS [Sclerotinia trifoliorum]|uniref:B1c3478c-0cf1-4eef-af48-bbafc0175a85-CDS n=1 Tax=Sclerotinia trifoliorum TaxID=28548 RepID=A0A8H2VS41_9HELO|nr:b1c3478c-0cf1-4eef-af48-bbafc0175a85-CDS [Sclerotinia trifoliorum]